MKRDQDRDQDVSKDLGTSSDRAMYSPSDERGPGGAAERNQGADEQGSGTQDAGRTQGGGSGGHSPAREVQEQTNIRNNSRVRDKAEGEVRDK